MKSIENKETEVTKSDETGKIVGKCTYADLISICLRQPKHGGYDYQDMENMIEIFKNTKDNPEVIELEDSYFTYLKKSVAQAKWNFYHEDVLTFRDYINSIK